MQNTTKEVPFPEEDAITLNRCHRSTVEERSTLHTFTLLDYGLVIKDFSPYTNKVKQYYNLNGDRESLYIGENELTMCVAINKDKIVGYNQKKIEIFSPVTGVILKNWPISQVVNIEVHGDGIITKHVNSTIQVWTQDGEQILSVNGNNYSVTDDGELLLLRDRSLLLINVETGKEEILMQFHGIADEVFYLSGEYCLCYYGNIFILLNYKKCRIIVQIDVGRGLHSKILPLPNNKFYCFQNGFHRIWCSQTGKLLHTLEGEYDTVLDKTVSYSDNEVLFSSHNLLVLWNYTENTYAVNTEFNIIDFSLGEGKNINLLTVDSEEREYISTLWY
jgi:hypothetical protein